MRRLPAIRCAVAAAVLLAALPPATAAAWQVTVEVHGAGEVVELSPAARLSCTTPLAGMSTRSVTLCEAAGYGSSDVVELEARVAPEYGQRGWRFDRWVHGEGTVDCDPARVGGDHFHPTCRFEVAGDARVRVRFDDVAAPGVSALSEPPAALTREQTATFSFASDDPDAGFGCRLERADTVVVDWYSCGGPGDAQETFSGLARSGRYTVRVRASDPTGNVGQEQQRTWTVDAVAPDTVVITGLAEGAATSSTTAVFRFASPESGVSFECRLDGAPFAPCASPHAIEDLPDGDHVFEVRARDTAGNLDPSPGRRTWRVESLDADRDGFDRPGDCDDAEAAVHPGATDVPGNAIDEDCAGGDAAAIARDAAARRHAFGDVAYALVAGRRGAQVRSLRVRRLAPGSVVRVRCRGGGCPFSSRRLRPAGRTLEVARLLRGRRLAVGARLELRVSAPAAVTKLAALTVRSSDIPAGRVRCLPPGAGEPVAC